MAHAATAPAHDPFRPRNQPAKMIYDGILLEAQKRRGTHPDVWVKRERENVWRLARDYAQQKGLSVLTIEDVEKAEMSACGHTDYAAKWAYGVSERLLAPKPHQSRTKAAPRNHAKTTFQPNTSFGVDGKPIVRTFNLPHNEAKTRTR